jgi:hypothetical protein
LLNHALHFSVRFVERILRSTLPLNRKHESHLSESSRVADVSERVIDDIETMRGPEILGSIDQIKKLDKGAWRTFRLDEVRSNGFTPNFLSISGDMGVCRSVTFKAPVRPFCEPRSHLQSGNAITGLQSRLDQRKQALYLTNTWQIDCVFMPFVSQPCAIDSVDSFDRFSLVKSLFGGCR